MRRNPQDGTRERVAPAADRRGYLEQILRYGLSGALEPGEIVIINVLHDDDCPRLRNGRCQCTPDITAVKPLARRSA
jgi:hypothetical protein